MMKQILIATHGKMASGIRYTLELVVGKMAEITTLDAYVDPEDDEMCIRDRRLCQSTESRIAINQKLLQ